MNRYMKGKIIAKKSISSLAKKDSEPMFCIGEVIEEDEFFYKVKGFEFQVKRNENQRIVSSPVTEEVIFDIPKVEKPYVVKPKRYLSEQVYQILEQWDNEITVESFRSMKSDLQEKPFNPLKVAGEEVSNEG